MAATKDEMWRTGLCSGCRWLSWPGNGPAQQLCPGDRECPGRDGEDKAPDEKPKGKG